MNSEQALPRTRTHRALLSDDVVNIVLSFLASEAGGGVYPACKLYRDLWRRRCAGLFRVLRSPVGDLEYSEQVTAYGDGVVVANYGAGSNSCLKTYSPDGDHVSNLLVGISSPTAVAIRGDGTAWVLLSDDELIHCMRLDDPTCSVIMEIDPDHFYPDRTNMQGTSCRVCDIGLAGDRLLILSHLYNWMNEDEQASRVHVVDDATGALLYQLVTCPPSYQARCFALQDDTLYLAGLGNTAIHTYNWRQGSVEGTIRLGGELAFRKPTGVAVSGKMLYVSERGDSFQRGNSSADVAGRIWILRLPNDASSDPTVVQVIPSPDGAELGGICLNGGQLWCMGPDERSTHMHLLGPCY